MPKLWLLATALLGITMMPHSLYGQASGDSFRSLYAQRDVVVMANPQSSFWKNAPVVIMDGDNMGHPVPGHRTEIRSRWTKTNLYLLFTCPYDELYLKPAPVRDQETNKLWNWDVAEIFIGTDFETIQHYKEFELSPQGEWIDLDINLDLPDHEVGWVWNSGFTVAARIDTKKKIWYGAMRIPFAAIDERPPSAGNTFRANLFRSQGPPENHKSLAWKPPMADSFHTPERFGMLELIGPAHHD